MKKLIVVLILGIAIGVSSSAGAAGWTYWKRGGSTYMCEGIRSGVSCKETNWKPGYGVHFVPGSVLVTFSGRVIFGCDRGITPTGNCNYYGQ